MHENCFGSFAYNMKATCNERCSKMIELIDPDSHKILEVNLGSI